MGAKKKGKLKEPAVVLDSAAVAPQGRPGKARCLRLVAEEKLAQSPAAKPEMQSTTPEKIIHELQVHQIELEMQNDELKRMQLDLEESRDRYLDLYDFAPVGYFSFTHAGRIVDVNLTGAALLGVPRAELINRGLGSFVAPEDLDRWEHHLMSATQSEEKQNCELVIVRADGSKLNARLESARLNPLGGQEPPAGKHGTPVVRTALSDITEREQAVEALQRTHDDLEHRVREDLEHRVRLRTAQLHTANEELQQEIAERKNAQQSLLMSQANLTEAQRIAHLGSWDLGLVTNDMACSDEVFRILGYEPQSFSPDYQWFLDRVHPEDRALVAASIRQAVDTKEPYGMTFRIVLPDSEIRILDGRGELLLDAQGTPIRMLGTLHDITEHVKAEEEVKQQQKQLVQADKMASLGILVSGIAHEINNPNHSILANASALLSVWKDLPPILDRFYDEYGDFVLGGNDYSAWRDRIPAMLASLVENSKRIQVIVQELRDFSRYNPTDLMSAVNVNAVVESANILIGNLIKKATDRFQLNLATGLPSVRGNFQRIEQVVLNLLQNACQALPGKERGIFVSTRLDEAKNAVVFEVRDEGTGISIKDVRHIADPFFTTKRGTGGMGLGLWICTNIVQEHGGVLSFESIPGEGTAVRIVLPALTQETGLGQ